MNSEGREELLVKSIKGGKGAKKMSLSEMSNFLRNNKVDLNKVDSHGYNLLHHAIKTENFEAVNLFLTIDEENYMAEKANPNHLIQDDQKSIYLNPTLYALVSCNDSTICSKIIKALIKNGCDIGFKDEESCSLYLRATEKGKIDIIDYLISLESIAFNINETCSTGSALHMAIIGDHEELISYLLEKKIDLNLRDAHGNTTLHLALQLKMNNSFKLIQDYIISNWEYTNDYKKELFNAQNEEGNTILHELAFSKCNFLIEMVRKFPSEYAVNPELTNKEGFTYKGVQENIVKLQKEKEERIRQTKETIRLEKEKIAKEKLEENSREKKEMTKLLEAEEKQRQFGEMLIKYRGIIFGVVFCVFLLFLYILVNNATKKKEKILY